MKPTNPSDRDGFVKKRKEGSVSDGMKGLLAGDADKDQWRDYLEIKKLHVEFDGFVAVDDVDITVTHGDLRFLIGPNGAGKTTLIDAITGLVPAKGSVVFQGIELLGKKPNVIVKDGVGRTFQTASVVEELDVVENLQVAEGFRQHKWRMLGRMPKPSERVREVLEITGLKDDAHEPAGILPHGKKQWLEIGMLLIQNARLLLLDEPVAGMSVEEREATGNLLKSVAKERTVIIVEHDMDFMRSFADSVTVMNHGSILAEGSVDDIQANDEVVKVYLGSGVSGNGNA